MARFLVLSAFLFVLGLVSPAQAEIVNLLDLTPGKTGSFVVSPNAYGILESQAMGLLAPNAKVTFSYEYSAPVGLGITVGSSLGYTPDTHDHLVAALSSGGYVEASDSLVLASANVDPVRSFAQTVVANLTAAVLHVQSNFLSLFHAAGSVVTVSYAVSTVPLPAALPMFGVALVGLAAVRRRSKAKV